ncbi:MAG: GGDEF domain-containing protein [Candidatus Hydrogenedentota bacterium]
MDRSRSGLRDVLSSRLGRKIIVVLTLAVTVPLALFAAPMYFQTRAVAVEEADRGLKDYARFCGRHIVQTLSVAKAQLAYLSRGGTIPSGESYFRNHESIDPKTDHFPPWLTKEIARDIMKTGKVYLSPPFRLQEISSDGDFAVGMALLAPDGRILTGVIEPVHLWRGLATTARSRESGFFILNKNGIPVTGVDGEMSVSSNAAPLVPLDANTSRPTGASTLPGVGIARWAHERLFLAGMFLSDEWGILTYRREASVLDLPWQLFSSLAVLLLVSALAVLVISTKTAGYLYSPIARLTQEAARLGQGQWDAAVHLERDDELGTLAHTFNDMASAIRASHQELESSHRELQDLNLTLEKRVRDRTQALEESEQRARHDALHDPLTGLPNRMLLGDRIRKTIQECQREISRRFAVLFIDLDRFKTINDTMGHQAGDEMIRGMAKRISASIRPGDTATRVSGDEFAVLLDEVRDQEEALAVATRLHEALAPPFDILGTAIQGSFSVGIALGSCMTTDADFILREADAAMYQAKAAGRGRTCVFDKPAQRAVANRMELLHELRRVVAEKRFKLVEPKKSEARKPDDRGEIFPASGEP